MSFLEKIKLPMRMQVELEDVFARRRTAFPSIDSCQAGIFQKLREIETTRAVEAEAAIEGAAPLRLKLFGKGLSAPCVKRALGLV